MCNERRATFQKVTMEDNGTVHNAYSLTLSRAQAWTGVILGILTIIAAFFTAATWTRTAVAEVAETTFQEQLVIFHNTAQPAIEKMVMEKISFQAAVTRARAEERIHPLEAEDLRMSAILVLYEKKLDRIEDKLDILIRQRASDGGV